MEDTATLLSASEKRLLLERRLGEARARSAQGAIPRRAGNEPAILSFAQTRLWFLDRLEPGNPFYNISRAVRLRGTLSIPALRASLGTIYARHGSLRTTFTGEDTPLQRIARPAEQALEIIDLRERAVGERNAETTRLAEAEAQAPFDLARGPLLRTKLLRLADDEYVLLLTIHHIVSDGWSMGIFFRELGAAYAAHARGVAPQLEALPVQYADYATWQRAAFAGDALRPQLEYWKRKLGGNLPVLSLPTDRPRPPVQTYRGSSVSRGLGRDLSAALEALSRQQNATPYMTLLAAFMVFLFRYTAQPDIVVGSPIAGRRRSELEPLIGFFVNTLVLRSEVRSDATFAEFLAAVRATTLEAYENQDVPFEKLVEELNPVRSMSYSPLFQVMFALQNAPGSNLRLAEIEVQPLEIARGVAQFDLTCEMTSGDAGLACTFEYNTDLFDDTTASRMLDHFLVLLAAIVVNPTMEVGRLPLMDEAERKLLVTEWSGANALVERNPVRCVHRLIEDRARMQPFVTAVRFAEATVSYGDLNARANQLGRHLRGLGVGRDTRVGICVERSIDMVVGMLAILKAGGAYVPLDPNYPRERLEHMIADAQVEVVLTQAGLAPSLPASNARLFCLDADWPTLLEEAAENLDGDDDPSALAYVIYTSGSTGIPKGVAVEHRALVNYLHAFLEHFEVSPADAMLQFSSMNFDASVEEIFAPLVAGIPLVLRTPDMLDSVELFLQRCREWNVTIVDPPTVFWNEIALAVERDKLAVDPLRVVSFGGEAASPARVSGWLENVSVAVRLANTYGPTEATIAATVFDATRSDANRLKGTVPIGRPFRNSTLFVLDDHLQPVPIGVPGQLYIGGHSLARGYLNRREQTAEKFVANPFAAPGRNERLYKTGDIVRFRADANVEFLGRGDDQVKIRGFRIELGEVETALGNHPAVDAAVARAVDDAQGGKRLVAYFVPRPSCEPSGPELAEFMKSALPAYMVPAAFVRMEEFPLTPSGKVDRKALPDAQPEFANATAYVAARNDVESQLATIWAEILGIARVGIHDNFFDLGGHSLLAVRMVSAVERAFGVRLPLVSLFSAPTVAELAATIEERTHVPPATGIIEIQGGDKWPPFFLLAGDFTGGGFYALRLAQMLGDEQPFYALPAHGLDGGDVPETIEAMADDYLRRIRAVAPHGPYLLGGYCNGGLVAYEIARRLQASGDVVALVVLIASQAHNPRHAGVQQFVERVARLLRLGPAARASLSLRARYHAGRWERFTRLPFHKRLGPLIADLTRLGKKALGAAPRMGDEEARVHRLTLAYGAAIERYEPKPFAGKIVALQPIEDQRAHGTDASMGWSRLAAVDVESLPGGHASSLTVHLEVVGTHLKRYLDEALGRESPPLAASLR